MLTFGSGSRPRYRAAVDVNNYSSPSRRTCVRGRRFQYSRHWNVTEPHACAVRRLSIQRPASPRDAPITCKRKKAADFLVPKIRRFIEPSSIVLGQEDVRPCDLRSANSSPTIRMLPSTAGYPQYGTRLSDVSRISASVAPTVSAAFVWTRSGVSVVLLPTAASAEHAASSRVFASRPGRQKISPKECSTTARPISGGRRLPRTR